MVSKEHFDFFYALNNTEIVRVPRGRLETFGATVVNYHLVSELMDSVEKVRIREGRIRAHRPEIIVPSSVEETILEGFGAEAARYVEWLRRHENDLLILRYGFKIVKQESNEHIVSDSLAAVVERVKADLDARDDPLDSLLIGVDEPWEVCLLKLMVEVVQNSAAHNASELQRDPQGHRREIEREFRAAARDASRIPGLSAKLRAYGLFEEYEDRFFALVRSHRS